MKSIPCNQLKKVLRQRLGFLPTKGNGTGHAAWKDGSGRVCHPVLRHKDVAFAYLFSLSLELEAKGVIPHRQFMSLLR